MAEKRREAKGKGEKERYIHLNAGFQRIAGRNKKGFLIDQCKEIEENNRMGKTRNLFKKMADTKGTFYAKMVTKKDRYNHLHAEFQRIAKRDKKAFFNDRCKEIEENNRMRKTRDHCKKIRDIKGTFHAKMGLIKDRNGRHQTEAEDIKKKWQEYTEELTKKIFTNQIITMV